MTMKIVARALNDLGGATGAHQSKGRTRRSLAEPSITPAFAGQTTPRPRHQLSLLSKSFGKIALKTRFLLPFNAPFAEKARLLK
jgi:hypothetical protein